MVHTADREDMSSNKQKKTTKENIIVQVNLFDNVKVIVLKKGFLSAYVMSVSCGCMLGCLQRPR